MGTRALVVETAILRDIQVRHVGDIATESRTYFLYLPSVLLNIFEGAILGEYAMFREAIVDPIW